jgi:hypothetical protein
LVERHLTKCEACREEARREGALVSVLEDRRSLPLGLALRDRVVRRMLQAVRPAEPHRGSLLRRLPIAWAPAAALVVIVLGLWALWHWHDSRTMSGAAVVTLVVGEVEQRGPGGDNWRPVHVGDHLAEGSHILSRARGMLVFEMRSGATVSVGPDSAVSLMGRATLSAERGSLVAQTRAPLLIETPAGRVHTPNRAGQIGMVVGDVLEVAVAGYTAMWESGEPLPPISGRDLASLDSEATGPRLRPLDMRLLSWLGELERQRVRQLLRETHPSLLPPVEPGRGEVF